VVESYQDDVAQSFGIPTGDEEIRVCEAWTGSDYTWSYDVLGTVESMQTVTQPVQSTSYAYGSVTGYNSSGAQVDAAMPVNGTLFDLMNADAATRQASYDDPYYGIRANGLCDDPSLPGCSPSGGGPYCDDPTAPGCSCDPYAIDCTRDMASATSVADRSLPLLTFVLATPTADDGKYTRHGIRRRGIRALIDDSDEISRSPRGYRRFRRVSNGHTRILTIHPTLGLLVGEDDSTDDTSVSARHVWRRTATGYVRERSEITSEVTIEGKKFSSRTQLQFANVKIDE
jgi:hypothetical protein